MISFHPVRWDATLSLRIYARFVPEGGIGLCRWRHPPSPRLRRGKEGRGQTTEDRRQRAEDRGRKSEIRGQKSEDRGHGVDCEFRISKLGTRPKGGSPKDNCEFEKAQGGLEIVDFSIGSRLDVVDGSQKDKCRLKVCLEKEKIRKEKQ